MTTPKLNDNYFESRITRLEVTIENINSTLIRIEKKFDDKFSEMDKKLDSKFSEVDKKIDKLDLRMDKLENRMWQMMFILTSSIVCAFVGRILHWI